LKFLMYSYFDLHIIIIVKDRLNCGAVRIGDSKIYATIASHAARAEAVELDVGSASYADLARVLAYWELKCGNGFAPRRADIDPVDLVEALPRIMLVDVVPGVPVDFRYRLSGTGICDVHGANHTHKRPRDLMPPAYGELIHQHYCAVVQRRAPLLHLIVLDVDDRELSYARLLLPLSEDGTAVTMLMAIDSKEQNTRALKDYFTEVSRGR
jgi:hypothetical protein